MANIHDLKESVTEMDRSDLIQLMKESRANRREHVRNGGKKKRKSKTKKKKRKRKSSRVKKKGAEKKELQDKFKNMNAEQSKQMLKMLKEEMNNEG